MAARNAGVLAVFAVLIIVPAQSFAQTPCNVPTITTQPAVNTTVPAGQTVTLTVGVAETDVTYQWYNDTSGHPNRPVDGATTSTFTTPPLFGSTTYFVRVTRSCGSFTDSGNANVGTCSTPAITSEPQDVTIFASQTADLNFSASGAYQGVQWFQGSAGDTSHPLTSILPYTGYTTPPLSVTTQFWARAYAGACGTVDTRTVTVNVINCRPPTVTSQPANMTVVPVGSTATLTVSVAETDVTYQWYNDTSGHPSRPVDGATTSTFTTPPLFGSTTYFVRVTRSCGSFTDSGNANVGTCSTPAITSEPQDVTIFASQIADLNFSVTGAYQGVQWFQGSGGDTSHPLTSILPYTGYTTPPLSVTTQFWARAYAGACGTIDTRTVTVNVINCRPPTVTSQPANMTVVPVGSTATLTVSVADTDVTYQWYNDTSGHPNRPVDGATTSTFTTPPLFGSTTYFVRVTRSCGSFTDSGNANVGTCSTPAITSEPQDVTIFGLQTAYLNFSVTGAYQGCQWFQGSSGDTSHPVTGITPFTGFTTPPLSATTAYWARAYAGLCGTADTRTVTVSIVTCDLPEISQQPTAVPVIAEGQRVTLTVTATGADAYQWYRGSSGDTSRPLPGATQTSYTTEPLHGVQSYWVQIKNTCGGVNSQTLTISTCAPPVITSEPVDQTVPYGASADLTIAATGDTLYYQWFEGTAPDTSRPVSMIGPSPLFRTPALTSTTIYWVRLTSDLCGAVDSRTVTVTVGACEGARIVAAPSSVIVKFGEQPVVTVVATGSDLRYQWYAGAIGDASKPLIGATSASLTLPVVTSAQRYWVDVTSACGSASASMSVAVQRSRRRATSW